MTYAPSIKTKLLRMQLTLAAAIIIILSGAFLINDILFFKGSVYRHFNSTALILSRNLEAAIQFLDKHEAENVLSSLQTEPSIVAATLFDGKREVFAKYVNPHKKDVFSDMSKACESSGRIQNAHFIYHHDLGKDTPGVLCIEWDLKTVASDYKSYLGIFVLLLISGFLFAYILAVLFQRGLSKPIIQLADTTKSISESGDYSLRMPPTESRQQIAEINLLAEEFNKMLDHIQTSNERIHHEKSQAEQANRAKSVFLANISHELRTPMHGILSFARFGQQKIGTANNEKLKSYFDEISDCGVRLMTLLNDLLDLSKLEAGKATYTMQQNNLANLLRTVQSEMAAFAEEKTLKIALENTDLEALAECDAEKILQVLRNIVSNAIKFSHKNTTIVVKLERTQEKWRCSVTNKGVGIPKDECKSVFDTFTQSSVTRTGAGGTGLGLAICREIITHHGGEIWVESELGAETKFIFEIYDNCKVA